MTLPPSRGEAETGIHPPVAASYGAAGEQGVVPIVTDPSWVSPPRRRSPTSRSLFAWSIGIGVATLAITAGALVHLDANRSFDEALIALEAETAEARDAAADIAATADEATDDVDAAESVVAVTTDDLADPAARDVLTDATAANAAAVDDARLLLRRPVVAPSTAKPLWTWELFDAVPVLEARAADLGDFASELDAADAAIDATGAGVDAAAAAFFASVPASAERLEAAHVSARNAVVIDFRTASAAAARQTAVDATAVNVFTAYAAKARELAESSAAQLAAKAGPLYATRLEVEAYARSIAGGVLLEFDWAPFVNGVGGRTGISGTATWNTAHGGFSTITLSNSVAEMWPGAASRALVAHEVGHSITSKCHEMFDSADQAANEAWATAWAISMGHTNEGNGVQAYGYPPQELIDTAAACR